MHYNILLNETALNITNTYPTFSDTTRYVTIQSCKDYVAVTQFWNYAYQFMLGAMLIILIWALYKLGKTKAEEKIMNWLSKNEDDNDGNGDSNMDTAHNDHADTDSGTGDDKHHKPAKRDDP